MAVYFPGDDRPRNARDGDLLIVPRQGFESLREDGWSPYTLGRRLGSASELRNALAVLEGRLKSNQWLALGRPTVAVPAMAASVTLGSAVRRISSITFSGKWGRASTSRTMSSAGRRLDSGRSPRRSWSMDMSTRRVDITINLVQR